MKVNHIDIVVKILILAAATIITCVIVAVGMSAMNTAQDISETAISHMNSLNNEMADGDIKMYDDIYVSGSEVTNFIKKYLGDYEFPEVAPLHVYVKTNISENTYVNGSSISKIKSFADTAYIKPTAKFLGNVLKNDNDVIVGISFIQS